jgi:hypothetical protein
MKNRIIILVIAGMVPCAVAHAAKTFTINTNTAGELADTCGVKPGDPGADTKRLRSPLILSLRIQCISLAWLKQKYT